MRLYRKRLYKRKNSDVRELIPGVDLDAINIFKYKLCQEEPLALAHVEPTILYASRIERRS
ncbi:hypothetical protein ACM43_35080 [Bradyrhizobium sp. CCBAU 45321]|nr:hypothetical protein [Bradyrhizobium sp. CCBAU 45321]